jgi:hypothetical protein
MNGDKVRSDGTSDKACEGCSGGFYDVLRPCPVCKATVVDKRNLRAAAGGADPVLDKVIFCSGAKPTVMA